MPLEEVVEAPKFTLMLVMGIPCSGKSTYIKERCPKDWEIFDEKSMHNLGSILRYFKAAVLEQKNVIIEGIFASKQDRRKVIDHVLEARYGIECIWMNTPLEVCIQRNKNLAEDDQVSTKLIKAAFKSLEEPEVYDGFRRIRKVLELAPGELK